MVNTHLGKAPRVDPDAWVAPNAVLCGDVTVGPGCRILFGAQIIAEGGAITLGAECIVMENAVLRSTAFHSLSIGNNCLIGPNTHVVGAPSRMKYSWPPALQCSMRRASAKALRYA